MEGLNPGELLEALYRRTVGPEKGVDETVGEEPHRYYTAGIIDTVKREREYKKGEEEIFADAEGPLTDESDEEQKTTPEAVKPSLDPAGFPSSAGLMFSFERSAGNKFSFKLYLTYAEYEYAGSETGWKRKPHGYSFDISVSSESLHVAAQKDVVIENRSDTEKILRTEGDTYLYVKLIPAFGDEPEKIMLAFVNERDPETFKGKFGNEEAVSLKSLRCIYQPQMGLKITEGKVPETGPARLKINFKGLMCSVITRKQIIDLKEIYGDISFIASDILYFFGKEIKLEDLDYISTFIPFFIKLEPLHNDDYDFAIESERSDDELVKAFINEAERLIKDYENWINRITEKGFLKKESAESRNIEFIRNRMYKSLRLLKDKDDDKVRKAFSFALKTAALSAKWAGIESFSLRTFQVAYILTVLASLCEEGNERYLCDILNVPTGAGKTEAYLILAVFYAAYRRLIHGQRGGGTAIISRYTLRMLTIQQFLRTVRTFTAAELLRKTRYKDIFGNEPFSVGLWVGQGITPNNLKGYSVYPADGTRKYIPQMLDFLKRGTRYKESMAGVVSVCPACGAPLVIPRDFTKDEKEKEVFIPFKADGSADGKLLEALEVIEDLFKEKLEEVFGNENVDVNLRLYPNKQDEGYIHLYIKAPADVDLAEKLNEIWHTAQKNYPLDLKLYLQHPGEPYENEMMYPSFRYPGYRTERINNREYYKIFCPNPDCELNKYEVSIEAYIVDEYLYEFPPTFLLATIDKFTQLPCKDEVFKLFGDDKYEPPGLIIQDEIHLIEGPTGSVFGLYEIAVDYLCNNKAKYISSSATVKEANAVSRNVFARNAFIFPVSVETEEGKDAFFIKYPLKVDKKKNYRIYAGLCAFGKGAVTPQVDVYETLLRCLFDRGINHPIVGYYNEIKELARGVGLLKQDVKLRLGRQIVFTELSSRIRSEKIGSVLKEIERNFKRYNVILSTSIFGTGVDIPGLQLMVMRGQPKRTADYIQATGRVGRKENSLIVVIYGNTRPRDISHFEYFVPYHSALEEFIEDPSVFPFSSSISERIIPAVATVIFKKDFRENQSDLSRRLGDALSEIIINRNKQQAEGFKADENTLETLCKSISQRLTRCITKRGLKASCLYSMKQRGEMLLTSLPADIGGIKEKTCFQNVPSSMRNTEGEIILEIG